MAVRLWNMSGNKVASKTWDDAPTSNEILFLAKTLQPGRSCRLLYKDDELKPSVNMASLAADSYSVVDIAVVWVTRDCEQTARKRHAFAAIKADGSVVTWGRTVFGGDSSSVASLLQNGVVHITESAGGHGGAFAAIKADGSVVTWGSANFGGK